MTEEKDLIRIRWHVDRTQDPAMFMLICLHPDYQDLQVSVSSGEVTERVAKAKLMQEMFELGEKRGIEPRRLRFKINGIEEYQKKTAASTEAAVLIAKTKLLDDEHQQAQHHEHHGGNLGAQSKLGFEGLGLGLAEIAVGLAGDGADAALFRGLHENGNDHKKRCDDQHDRKYSSHKNKTSSINQPAYHNIRD